MLNYEFTIHNQSKQGVGVCRGADLETLPLNYKIQVSLLQRD